MKKLLLSLFIGTLSLTSFAQNSNNLNQSLTINEKPNQWNFFPNASQMISSLNSEDNHSATLFVFSNINFKNSDLNFTSKNIYLSLAKNDDLKCDICSLSIYKNNQEYKFNVLHTNNIAINMKFFNKQRQEYKNINLAFIDKAKILKLLLTPGDLSINFNNNLYLFKPKNTISTILNNNTDFSNWNYRTLNNYKTLYTQELTLLNKQFYGMELSIPIPNNIYGEPVANFGIESALMCNQCVLPVRINNINYKINLINQYYSKEFNTSILTFPLKDLINIKKIAQKNNTEVFSVELETVNVGKTTHYFNISELPIK